ncbi:hypothetical protein BG842_00645 [Haladaptatus sp. W1]|uniref:hypothetical protein n=1 Tax=Haladaptatus sp. W1 TaxID=1897478 RepID=UPI000849B6DC|nr:hypothetical protein [Haladaptatus sp. W1]ODR80943.1 hypothetical protein BG842_00645 [Haladaptatus sp. W1]
MRQNVLSILFALDSTLLVLLLISFQFVQTGTSEYAILQVSLAVIFITFVGLIIAARRGLTLFEP